MTEPFDYNPETDLVNRLGIIEIGLSVILAKIQSDRYERLVNTINKEGYDKRFCSLYMNRPCGRCLIKTVLKRTKNFDEYSKLKDKFPLTTILD